MASIVDLIARHGQGGQTYPARMAQLAQAKNTEQRTEIERQQADEQSAMRGVQLEQQQAEQAKRLSLNDIAQNSSSIDEWVGQLRSKGFLEESQQAQKFDNGLKEQQQQLDKGTREKASNEGAELSQMLRGVIKENSQEGLDAFFKQWNSKHPESDIDDNLPKEWNEENRSAFNIAIFAGQSYKDDWKRFKEDRIQGRSDRRADQADRRITQTDTRIDQKDEAVAEKKYQANVKTETGLRKEYTKSSSVVRGALNQIMLARNLLEQGKPFSDIAAQATVSKIGNSKVRALAELAQYKNPGNIQQRVSGFFARTFSGEYTEAQRKMGLDMLDEVEKMYQSAQDNSKDYYRYLAKKNNVDSHAVAKYDSPDEIMGNKFLSDEQKIELAEEVFPNYDWSK